MSLTINVMPDEYVESMMRYIINANQSAKESLGRYPT